MCANTNMDSNNYPPTTSRKEERHQMKWASNCWYTTHNMSKKKETATKMLGQGASMQTIPFHMSDLHVRFQLHRFIGRPLGENVADLFNLFLWIYLNRIITISFIFWWHLKCEKWRNLIHIHESKINSLVLSTISRCTCLHRCVSVVFCWFSVFGFVFVTISFPLTTQFHASDSKPWASSFAFVDGFWVAFCLFYLPQPSINYTHKLYGYKM